MVSLCSVRSLHTCRHAGGHEAEEEGGGGGGGGGGKHKQGAIGFSFSSRWHHNAQRGPYPLYALSTEFPQSCHRTYTYDDIIVLF